MARSKYAVVCKWTKRADCKSEAFGLREFESLQRHMTENKENTFNLVEKESRALVRMKLTGEPFVYTTRETARSGKRILENDRKVALVVVPG